MGRKYGTTTTRGGRKYGGGASGGGNQLEELARRAGIDPAEKKTGFTTRLFNVLSAFEPGGELATLLRTGDVGKAGKQYVSEVGRGLGSAIPALDPYTKPKELASEREGFKEAIEVGFGKPTTTAGKVAATGLGLVGDIFLDPGNVLLAGMFKTIGKGLKGTGKIAAKGLAKTEKGQDILTTLAKGRDIAGESFKTGYKVKKVSPDLAELTQNLKRTANVGDREAVDLVKKLVDKYGEDVVKKLPYEIEEAGQLLSKGKKAKVSPAAQEVVDLIESKTAGEVTEGLRKTSVEDYFPRKVVKEPFKGFSGALPPMKPSLKGAEKARVFETLKEGQKAGYQYLEAPEALAHRLAVSQRAQKVKGTLNKMVAGEVKDLAGNPIVRKLGESGAEGMVEFTRIKDLRGYVAHPDVVEYMEKVQTVFGNDNATKGMLKVYDKIHNIWKGSVTSYFPAFHVRNAFGNIFNNWVAGVKNPSSYIDASKIQKGTGKLSPKFKDIFPEAETFEDAQKILAELGVTGKGQFGADVPKLLQRLTGKEGIGRKALRKPREIGTAVEDNARIAHYVEMFRKGSSSKEAATSVNKFLFDYSDLTPFEQNVMKRIFPFYTFTRKNIPLQLEQVFKQPKKYKAVGDAIRNLQSGDLTPEEKKYMPDYIAEKFGISLGRSEKGYPQMLAGLGLPVEDLEKIGRPSKSILDMMTPALKTIPELVSGKSFFFGENIRDTSYYNATTKAVGDVPLLKQFLKAKPTKDAKGNTYYKVDPIRMYWLKVFAGRFVGTAEKLTDTRKDFLLRSLNSLTGMKVYTPDIDREKEKTLLKALTELGLVKTFSKEYVPKDVKGEFGL